MSRRFAVASFLVVALSLIVIAGGAQAGSPNRLAALQASPEATPCAATTETEATALATAFMEPFETGDVSVYDRILAPTYVHHWGVGEDIVGIAEQQARVAAFNAAFETWVMTDQFVIVAGDYVTVVWTASARQAEPLNGIAASNVDTVYTGINVFRIECGLIAEGWNESDHLTRLIQAGVITSDELSDAGTPTP